MRWIMSENAAWMFPGLLCQSSASAPASKVIAMQRSCSGAGACGGWPPSKDLSRSSRAAPALGAGGSQQLLRHPRASAVPGPLAKCAAARRGAGKWHSRGCVHKYAPSALGAKERSVCRQEGTQWSVLLGTPYRQGFCGRTLREWNLLLYFLLIHPRKHCI